MSIGLANAASLSSSIAFRRLDKYGHALIFVFSPGFALPLLMSKQRSLIRAAEPKLFTAGLTHSCARPATAATATCSSAFATLPPNTVLLSSPITCVS